LQIKILKLKASYFNLYKLFEFEDIKQKFEISQLFLQVNNNIFLHFLQKK